MNLNWQVKTIRASTVLPLLVALILAIGAADGFAASRIDWQVIAPAGNAQASSGYKLFSVTGQPTPVGEAAAGAYRLRSGYVQDFGFSSSCCDLAGDANDDGAVNISDAVFLVNYIFRGGAEPVCVPKADASGDGITNLGDCIYIINYVFKGGVPPICGP